MNQWLPVIATLSGAIIAGLISVLVSWRSNRNAMQHTRLRFTEERALWAVERRLENLKRFYSTVDKLSNATVNLRIQQAWEAQKKFPPTWVLSGNDARQSFEDAISSASAEAIFLDEGARSKFSSILEHNSKWMLVPTMEDSVQHLMTLEDKLGELRRWIGEHYRESFEDRRLGRDTLNSSPTN